MAKRRSTPTWAKDVLSEFAPSVLSRGMSIPVLRQDAKTKEVSYGAQPIRGTRLTARKVAAIASGERSPSRSDLQKLKSFRNRYNYNVLRASGASRKEAQRARASRIHEARSMEEDYYKAAKIIADVRGTTEKAVRHAMKKADIQPQNLLRRSVISGLRDWRGAMSAGEFNRIVDDMVASMEEEWGGLATFDEEEDE